MRSPMVWLMSKHSMRPGSSGRSRASRSASRRRGIAGLAAEPGLERHLRRCRAAISSQRARSARTRDAICTRCPARSARAASSSSRSSGSAETDQLGRDLACPHRTGRGSRPAASPSSVSCRGQREEGLVAQVAPAADEEDLHAVDARPPGRTATMSRSPPSPLTYWRSWIRRRVAIWSRSTAARSNSSAAAARSMAARQFVDHLAGAPLQELDGMGHVLRRSPPRSPARRRARCSA